MKPLAPTIRILALAAVFLPVLPVFAEQPPGFYIGVGIGDAEADTSTGDINDLFRSAFAAQGATFIPQTATIDTKDSHLYIFAGYRIFPYLSVDGGYVDLGSFEYTSRASLFIPGQGTSVINTSMKVESQGVQVNALGNIPISDYFEIHGRLGFFVMNTDADINGGTASRPVSASESGASFGLQIGVGAAVNIGDHFSLSADWGHYFDVDNGGYGEEEEELDYDGYDVDVLRVSAIVRF